MLYDCLVLVIAKLYCSDLVASYIHFIKQIILYCWQMVIDTGINMYVEKNVLV